MEITAGLVKELRDRTGAGMMECKRALQDASGDIEKAIDLLRTRGAAKAAKRAGREAREGTVGSYVHPGGRIGVMVEVNCETDFVARNDEFQRLVKELCMHIAASGPLGVSVEDLPVEMLERERAIAVEKVKAEGKPEHLWEKIADGVLKKFHKESALFEQPFVMNPDITVRERVQETISTTGENIVVRRFVRYALGE
ncbi:MAG: translation elongation factor Ts [Longimicrobiales bacterium]